MTTTDIKIDLAKARRLVCDSPHLCFEFGENVACTPCETLGAAVLKERERCARRVERFFAPCSGTLERRYGVTLAAHIREGT